MRTFGCPRDRGKCVKLANRCSKNSRKKSGFLKRLCQIDEDDFRKKMWILEAQDNYVKRQALKRSRESVADKLRENEVLKAFFTHKDLFRKNCKINVILATSPRDQLRRETDDFTKKMWIFEELKISTKMRCRSLVKKIA